MSVLNRAALEESPLADLHELASELSIDGYRRLRREDLVDAILERQGGSTGAARRRPSRRRAKPDAEAASPAVDAEEESTAADDGEESAAAAEGAGARSDDDDAEPPKRRRSRRGRGGSGGETTGEDGGPRASRDATSGREAPSGRETGPGRGTERGSGRNAGEADEMVEGVVELLPNGSGFVRVDPPEPSDQDVYISAAQIKRCELVSGDRVSGPRRPPRRSERFASLVRVDTVNDRPADELADAVRYEDLPATLPHERIALGSEDPTLKAIEWLTPFGRGSRVTICGGPRAGKTEALRRLAEALRAHEDLQVSVALSGVRPEEASELSRGEHPPVAAVSFAASPDTQAHTVELVVDQARRLAARGGHAVVLIDTLDGLAPHTARRVVSAARAIVDGGSLTLIATATEPVGGETTVIALDAALTGSGRFPAIDLASSGTVRPELLVGEEAAAAIARAREEALEG